MGYIRTVDSGDTDPGGALPDPRPNLPEREITVNAVVALNLAYFRKAASLSQAELGDRIGWGKSMVSTAERSANEAGRVRQFSASDLVAIARALKIPLAALFLPPEGDDTAARYVISDGREGDATTVQALLFPPPGADHGSPVMDAYRKRLIALGWSDSAYRDADEALEQTRREANRIIARAAEHANAITGSSRDRAEELIAQARQEALADLDRQRAEMERRVDDLRAFEREYRAHMKNYLDGVLRAFWWPAGRPEVEQMIETMHQDAAERGAGSVTAVMLGEDGTYAVYRADQEAAEPTDPQDEGAADEGQRLPAVLLP